MTTGASLISLQPYQAPCPRYKCHLSPRDCDRKPSRASCHKHRFGILQKTVSLFYCLLLSVYSSISSSTHTHMHMRANTHVHSKNASTTLLTLLLMTAGTRTGCLTFSPFQENWGISSHCVKAQKKNILSSENTLLCIRHETLSRLSHTSSLGSSVMS